MSRENSVVAPGLWCSSLLKLDVCKGSFQSPEPTYTAGEIADPAFYRVQPAALPDIEALRYDLERLKDELRIESHTKAALQARLVLAEQERDALKEANRNATS